MNEPTLAPKVGEHIADYLRALGWTEEEFANRCGFSPEFTASLLREDVAVRADVALTLERVLKRPADYWLRLREEPRKPRIVMYDSPEAAHKEVQEVWVSQQGGFPFYREGDARYAGCTHRRCECGAITEWHNILCPECSRKDRAERTLARYNSMEKAPWDGKSPVYSLALDKYLFHGSHTDYLDEMTEEDLLLIHCDPVYLHELESDVWEEELNTEDGWMDLPEAVDAALSALNEAIKKAPPVSWIEGSKAVALPIIGGNRG